MAGMGPDINMCYPALVKDNSPRNQQSINQSILTSTPWAGWGPKPSLGNPWAGSENANPTQPAFWRGLRTPQTPQLQAPATKGLDKAPSSLKN